MTFSLGSSLTDLNVQQPWTGFDYPSSIQTLELLGNGTDAGNAVLQSSDLPFRVAEITGTLEGLTDVGYMRAIYESQSSDTFTDDDAISRLVVITDLTITRRAIGVYDYRATLAEISVIT